MTEWWLLVPHGGFKRPSQDASEAAANPGHVAAAGVAPAPSRHVVHHVQLPHSISEALEAAKLRHEARLQCHVALGGAAQQDQATVADAVPAAVGLGSEPGEGRSAKGTSSQTLLCTLDVSLRTRHATLATAEEKLGVSGSISAPCLALASGAVAALRAQVLGGLPVSLCVHRGIPAQHASGGQWRLGLLADVQHADVPDGTSYSGVARYFRGAAETLDRILASLTGDWGVDAIVHCGDLIDGRAKSGSLATLRKLLRRFPTAALPCAFAIGNHELYHTRREDVSGLLGLPPDRAAFTSMPFPGAGVRVIVLDAFDIGVKGWPASHPHAVQAHALVRAVNPNHAQLNDGSMLGDRGSLHRRWVAYNGAVGAAQLAWLHAELAAADADGCAAVVIGHVTLHPQAGSKQNTAWNYAEVQKVLHAHASPVAYFAGHDHTGGYAVDAVGVHHLTLDGIIELEPEAEAYAVLAAWPLQGEATTAPTRLAFGVSSVGKTARWQGGPPQRLTTPRFSLFQAVRGVVEGGLDASHAQLTCHDLVAFLGAATPPGAPDTHLVVLTHPDLSRTNLHGGSVVESLAAAAAGFPASAETPQKSASDTHWWWPRRLTPGLPLGQELRTMLHAHQRTGGAALRFAAEAAKVRSKPVPTNLAWPGGADKAAEESTPPVVEGAPQELQEAVQNTLPPRDVAALWDGSVGGVVHCSVPACTIRHLSLAHNALTGALPDVHEGFWSTLTCLEELDVSGNALTALPASLASAPALQRLDLSGNNFSALPECLAAMPSLKHVIMKGNPMPPASQPLPGVEVEW